MLKKILPVFVLVFLLTACGGTASPEKKVTLELTDFAFGPSSVTIPAGQPVLITLENKGVVEHDFVIEKIDASMGTMEGGSEMHHMGGDSDFAVHAAVQAGGTASLELTVAEPGTYQFFCSVPGHKEAGMTGELIVVAQQ
ncbi:MAG TPA: cupredoxin domain-containing protein [Anaerolineales bacterium]|nr:cupredoxin domain-containing protein [Anaerolineales bacterium]